MTLITSHLLSVIQEEAAREEQLAMQKIAATLADLTTKRIARVSYQLVLICDLNRNQYMCLLTHVMINFQVSEASKNIENTNLQENQLLLQEMSKMQQVSVTANKELNDYAERMKIHFIEETFASAETKAMIAGCIEEW